MQNEIADIFRDDLTALTDEADGGGGGKKDSLVSEAQSFTHLTFSKNKVGPEQHRGLPLDASDAGTILLVQELNHSLTPSRVSGGSQVVSAIQWLPHRKGVVAVACTEAQSHAERVARMGRTQPAHILVWNFRDPIHPELVLQSPWEVFAFQFNPVQPDILTGRAAGERTGRAVVVSCRATSSSPALRLSCHTATRRPRLTSLASFRP